jgi:hypothetical protein
MPKSKPPSKTTEHIKHVKRTKSATVVTICTTPTKKDLSGIPLPNAPLADVVPITKAKKAPPKQAPKTKKKKTKKRERQLYGRCVKAGSHADLKGLSGIVTIDYVDDVPVDVTFDPTNRRIKNALIPVGTLTENRGWLKIVTEEGDEKWTFRVEPDDPYEAFR